MKVYRDNSDNKPKRRLSKRGVLTMAISAVLLIAATATTLVLTLGGGEKPLDPIDTNPIGTVPAFVLPVDEVELGKTFSLDALVKHKTLGFWQTHEGVDFLTAQNASIKSISEGTVISVVENTIMEGTVIKIQHANGVVSIYKGLAGDVKVKEGDKVNAGDVIGTVGTMNLEARDYEKPHLHLEVTLNGKRVNPLNYLPSISDK